MDKIARIRAEIERHRQAIRVLNEHTAPEQMSKTCAIFQYSDSILSELLSFLDTLSEEPDKSLEEYASRAGFDYVDGIVQEEPGHRWNDHDVEFAYRDGIIAGAEWGAEHLK